MNLKDILSISGEHGLFKFIAQGRNAIIVEHLETKKRKTAFASAKVSSLEDISIFTEKEDLPLSKVFDLIFELEKGGPAIDAKSEGNELKEYFEKIVPDYDKEKVYVSDMKKVIIWYNTLQNLGMLIKEEPESTESKETEKETEKESEPAVKPDVKKKTKAAQTNKIKAVSKLESKSAGKMSKGRPKTK
jgi:hypothetical protein